MSIRVLGPKPFEPDPSTGLVPKVGTLMLRHRVLVTTLPAVHAFQRQHFFAELNQQRQADGLPPLTPAEERAECDRSVALFFQDHSILVRPVPERIALALEADEQLQELVPKHRIRFLHARHRRVREALRTRGELWRISEPPHSVAEMEDYLRQSLVAIGGRAIYRINKTTGTRWLTLHQLRELDRLPNPELAAQMAELARFCGLYNRAGYPELCFIPKCDIKPEILTQTDFATLPEDEVRQRHRALVEMMTAEVPPDLRKDEPKNALWRNAVFNAVTEEPEGTLTGEVVGGLSEAFYQQVQWLPDRFEQRELIFDPIFQSAAAPGADEALRKLCDPSVREFILNFLREFGELDYVNVGRVITPAAARPRGRRAVYIAEIKPRNELEPLLRIIRMNRWGIREHLYEGENLLAALLKANEYAHYVLDRRLACQQLGMRVPLRVSCWDIPEEYVFPDGGKQKIWAGYYERDYVAGTAANKLSEHKLAQPEYALRLARLLGGAAAANLVIGRAEEGASEVIFDKGDEVVIEDEARLPQGIVICDHSRSFGNYRDSLAALAPAYAKPVNVRTHLVQRPRDFANAYLQGLGDRLTQIRGEYLARPNAFRQLFQHLPVDAGGSFGYRWLKVLERLDQADPAQIVELVRRGITVL